MNWVLIIIGIAGAESVGSGYDNRAVTALQSVEFESQRACEQAAFRIKSSLTRVKTVCVKRSDEIG